MRAVTMSRSNCDGEVGISYMIGGGPRFPSHVVGILTGNRMDVIVAGGAVWSIQVGGGQLYGFAPTTGAQTFSLAVGSANHFATPSADGNELFLPLSNSIEGVSFVTA